MEAIHVQLLVRWTDIIAASRQAFGGTISGSRSSHNASYMGLNDELREVRTLKRSYIKICLVMLR